FFFQAEDGIRDFHVTGVQTCALPICGVQILATHCVRRGNKMKEAELFPTFFETNALGIMAQFSDEIHDVKGKQPVTEKARILKRSEERRVGKEWRSRSSRSH